MRKAFSVAVAVVVVAMVLAPMQAQAQRGAGQKGRGFYLLRCLNRLNLTETQKAQVREVVKRHRVERVKLLEDLVKAKEHLRDLMESDNVTDAEVTVAWNRVASVKGKMVLLRMKVKREVLSILTPDQKLRLKEMILMRRLRSLDERPRWGKRAHPKPVNHGNLMW